jgi:5-formyltetrahydrofolate cyclo-ligase
MDKSAIRKMHLEMRKAISEEMKMQFSEKISNNVLGYLKSNPEIRHIHLFLSITRLNEVNTLPLLEKLQDLGYILYTSYVNPASKVLDTVEITHIKEFDQDSFGIPIPKNINAVGNGKIQLVLVPLLAFDIEGNRLGYGKGYYDQFLASISPKIMKAGLSFFPPTNEIPVESHDIGLDICITPDMIYYFGHH